MTTSMNKHMSIWRSLRIPPEELRLDTTLKCGQAFRWKVSGENSDIEYQSYFPIKKSSDEVAHEFELIDKFLMDYFNLSSKINLRECYDRWSMADKHFSKIACQFKGIRILRQDPVENLFCFICSTNNNIARISQMIEKLCNKYGNLVYTLNGQEYYDFPTLDKLVSSNVESELRQLGFGYRAKYITQTAKFLTENYSDAEKWLYSLRNVDYKVAHSSLLKLSGVNKHNAIPIDTHVWQIAQREYGFNSKGSTKTLTSRLYEAIGDHFRNLFGDYSGWAHSVLFTADLKAFQDRPSSFTTINTNIDTTLSKSDLDSSILLDSDKIVFTKKRSRSKNIQKDSILLSNKKTKRF
ncbi:43403_t:CDS:2 [Gigaspora margarita]|uniref:DNA-(apurinic or apyrimidinic site) lyase n=1 Tax=Gigaspora margarita TaxID=4874 RepID=A0ABN7URK5_GIGMA|nr:43403_t:CDS:2 [Gigaspora margarita]